MQLWRASALIWAVGVEARLQPPVAARSKRRIDAATTLRGGFGGGLLESYTNLLAKAPLRTNMVTAACLAMTSDAVAQRLCVDTEAQLDECAVYDYPRTAWIALWGSVVSGAMLQQWFVLLRYLFPLYKTSNWQLAGVTRQACLELSQAKPSRAKLGAVELSRAGVAMQSNIRSPASGGLQLVLQ